MKKALNLFVTSCLCFFLFLLGGCRSEQEPTHFSGRAMGMDYTVQIGDPLSPAQEVEIEQLILSTFTEINQIYNNWNPDSEISTLNKLPAHEKISLSPELTTLLHEIDRLVTLTEGRFDPTIEPLQQLWKKNLRAGSLPTEEEIASLTPAIGWEKIHLEEDSVWKEHPLTAIDLGGIAKGVAVDLLIDRLVEGGFHSCYVNWSGEVRTHGKHPAGRSWRIGIYGGERLELDGEALATSGSYFQQWEIHERLYTHILDPRAQIPLSNPPLTSVSVKAKTCTEADALATALMLFATESEARAWAEAKKIAIPSVSSRDPSPASSPVR